MGFVKPLGPSPQALRRIPHEPGRTDGHRVHVARRVGGDAGGAALQRCGLDDFFAQCRVGSAHGCRARPDPRAVPRALGPARPHRARHARGHVQGQGHRKGQGRPGVPLLWQGRPHQARVQVAGQGDGGVARGQGQGLRQGRQLPRQHRRVQRRQGPVGQGHAWQGPGTWIPAACSGVATSSSSGVASSSSSMQWGGKGQ